MFSQNAEAFDGLIEIESISGDVQYPPPGVSHEATLGQMLAYLRAGTVAGGAGDEGATTASFRVAAARWAPPAAKAIPIPCDLVALARELDAVVAQLRQRIAAAQ